MHEAFVASHTCTEKSYKLLAASFEVGSARGSWLEALLKKVLKVEVSDTTGDAIKNNCSYKKICA